MADKGKVTIEGKSDDDDAWYTCTLNFDGKQVMVHFTDFGTGDDEVWNLDDFQCREDVLNKVRIISDQLQDEGCHNVYLGLQVCALKERKPDEKDTDEDDDDFLTYFDAEVVNITRREHVKNANGDEECKCTFRVRWEDGPDDGEAEDLDCSAITVLSDRNPEDNPDLRTFLHMVSSNLEQKRSILSRKVGRGHMRAATNARKTRKKIKRVASVRDELKCQPQLRATVDKESFESPTTHLAERDVFSTTAEMHHLALHSKNGETGCSHPLKGKDESAKTQGGRNLRSASSKKEVSTGSLRKTLGVKTTGFERNSSSGPEGSDHRNSTRTADRGATGLQTSGKKISSDYLVTAAAEASGLYGPPTSVPPREQGTSLAHKSNCISDVKDNRTKVFPEGQLAEISDVRENASEEVERRISAIKKVCSNLWPINRIFRIDNLEKDLSQHVATTFLCEVFKSLISVFLLPAGENETSRSGFLIFEDSQSAEDEALQLVQQKVFVTSQHLRPWSVRWAKDSKDEKALIAFTARGCLQATLESIELSLSKSQESLRRPGQLRWILPGMKDCKVVTESLELHLAQRRELHELWKKINRDEAAKKLQAIY